MPISTLEPDSIGQKEGFASVPGPLSHSSSCRVCHPRAKLNSAERIIKHCSIYLSTCVSPGFQTGGFHSPTWRTQGLNLGPSADKADALPMTYSPTPKSSTQSGSPFRHGHMKAYKHIDFPFSAVSAQHTGVEQDWRGSNIMNIANCCGPFTCFCT